MFLYFCKAFSFCCLNLTCGLDAVVLDYPLFSDFSVMDCCSDEIARCLEKAYEKIGFSEARRMVFIDNDQMMLDYSREVRNSYCRKKYSQQLEPLCRMAWVMRK